MPPSGSHPPSAKLPLPKASTICGRFTYSSLFPQAGTPTGTPSPRKGVGFQFDGATPSTDNDSTGALTPPPKLDIPRPKFDSPLASDSEETSMDIADDNLTLPLPPALLKRAPMQRGVGFLIDDGDEDLDMDVTQPLGGIIAPPTVGDGVVPSMDGVNRFLSGQEEDQTMEFTRLYSPKPVPEEDDTVGMEFTKVVGKIRGLAIPAVDKENHPPPVEDENDGPYLFWDKSDGGSNDGHDSRLWHHSPLPTQRTH